MDATTAAGADPVQVAHDVWRFDAAGRGELVTAPLKVRIACLLRALAPRLLFGILAKRAVKEAETM
jgi:hypothetical protein